MTTHVSAYRAGGSTARGTGNGCRGRCRPGAGLRVLGAPARRGACSSPPPGGSGCPSVPTPRVAFGGALAGSPAPCQARRRGACRVRSAARAPRRGSRSPGRGSESGLRPPRLRQKGGNEPRRVPRRADARDRLRLSVAGGPQPAGRGGAVGAVRTACAIGSVGRGRARSQN